MQHSGSGAVVDDDRRERVRRTLASGAVDVHFQPVADLRTGAVVAYEALARFPGAPGATGLFADAALVGLGAELEELAVRWALAGIRAGAPGVPVGLNLSPTALLSPRITDLLLSHRTDGLAVEITEHAPVEDYDALLEVTRGLRAAGIGLAVDDAGAGYASLQHILRLEPDTIKIDIGIVSGLHRHRPRAALVSALATFAAETGSVLLAEGIEEPAERDALLARGVHLGQGYLLGRPAPLPRPGRPDGPAGQLLARSGLGTALAT